MIVNIPLLLLAVALLWFPRRWLRLGAVVGRRRRGSKGAIAQIVEPWRSRERGDPRVSFFSEFTKFRNYVDLLRAGAGSIVLFGALGLPSSLTLEPAAPRNALVQVAVIRIVVMIVGLLVQMVRREKGRLQFYPPVFYLAGATIGPCGADAAACAFALAWAFNLGLPNAQALLSVYALLLFSVSALFSGRLELWPSFASCLIFLPVLLSLLARKPLMVLTRKAPRSASPT